MLYSKTGKFSKNITHIFFEIQQGNENISQRTDKTFLPECDARHNYQQTFKTRSSLIAKSMKLKPRMKISTNQI